MRWLAVALLALVGSCLATGCSLVLDKNGAVGITVTVQWDLIRDAEAKPEPEPDIPTYIGKGDGG